MNLRRLSIIVLLAILSKPVVVTAQIDDVGLWIGASAEKKMTRKLSFMLGEQLRLKNNMTEVNQFLTDAGIEYNLSKKLRGGLHYRFISSNQDNNYSSRHRIYINLAYKEKFDWLTLTLRERLQNQYNDINSSETGKVPVWTLRTKLTAKFDINKNYTPYVACEFYYLIDNAKEIDQLFSRSRYEAGLSYDFNRMHSLNPYVLYQHDMLIDYNELIYGITYEFTF
jgi:hypothetical protein